MTVLITGAAGFIGFHLSLRLLEQGVPVVGFDNVNPYYDPALKKLSNDNTKMRAGIALGGGLFRIG